MKELECKRCGHLWISVKKDLPQVCPRCKSYKWNESKKEEISRYKELKEKHLRFPCADGLCNFCLDEKGK